MNKRAIICTVRKAKIDDLKAVLTLSKALFDWAEIDDSLWDTHRMGMECSKLILGEDSGVFIAEADGKKIGMVVMASGPAIFNEKVKVATEIGWWIEPSYRYGSVIRQLISSIKNWAKNKELLWVHLHLTRERMVMREMEGGLCHQQQQSAQLAHY